MSVSSQNWLDAQYSVLGSALIEPSLVPRVINGTSEADYSGPCLTVFRAMRKLAGSGISVDVVTLRSDLGSGYADFLMSLMEITPTAANLDTYIALCREQSRILAVRDIGQQLCTVEKTEDARQLVGKASSLMVARWTQNTVTLADCLKSLMERPSGRPDFLPWPISQLQQYLAVPPGKYILIGAAPSVGKTAFSLQCSYCWAKTRRVGFFSLETDPDTLFYRLLSGIAHVPLDNIVQNSLTHAEWDRVCQATQDITASKLEIIPAAGLSTADIAAKTIERQYDVIVVDYVQITQPASGSRSSNRFELVTHVSMELHTIAQRLGVIVVGLCQLKRMEDDHIPKMSDLRESGQLEQDADIIMILKLRHNNDKEGPRQLYGVKYKEGKDFYTMLNFDGDYQTFSYAPDTGVTAQKYITDGKKARRLNKQATQAAQMEQMEMLPDNTPVPFRD